MEKSITIKQGDIMLGLTFTTAFLGVFCAFLLYYLFKERKEKEDLEWELADAKEDLEDQNEKVFELSEKLAKKPEAKPTKTEAVEVKTVAEEAE